MASNTYIPKRSWSEIDREIKQITFLHKRLGILGGMGVDATGDLYDTINRVTREYIDVTIDQDYLAKRISDNPLVPDRSKFILYTLGVSPEPAEDPFPYLVMGIDDLALGRMPAKIVGIPCNTAHYFVPALEAYIAHKHYDIKIVHMIQETVNTITASLSQVKKVGVLATTATLQTKLYNIVLEEAGYDVLEPEANDQKLLVMEAIFGNESEKGIKAGELTVSKEKMHKAAVALKERGADAIILGCTEIPLVLNASDSDVPLINPTEVLARKMVEQALEK